MLHFFRVISCCIFSGLHYINDVLSDCTIFMFFQVALFFSCCSLFIVNFFLGALMSQLYLVLHCFHVVPFLHSFHVAPFFVLLSTHTAPFFVVHSFHVAPFFFCMSFLVALFSCCSFSCYNFEFGPLLLTGFLFYSSLGALFSHCFSSHCAFFTLHPLMSHSFHVAPFPCSTFLMLHSFHNTLSQSLDFVAILKLLLIMQLFQ